MMLSFAESKIEHPAGRMRVITGKPSTPANDYQHDKTIALPIRFAGEHNRSACAEIRSCHQ
jgi:hypothetical protein